MHNRKTENRQLFKPNEQKDKGKRVAVIRELVISCLDLDTGTTFLRDVLSDNGHRKTDNFLKNQMYKRTRIAITATIINYDLL